MTLPCATASGVEVYKRSPVGLSRRCIATQVVADFLVHGMHKAILLQWQRHPWVFLIEWRFWTELNAGLPPAHCLALRLVVAPGALLNELELLLQDHRVGRNLRYYLQYPYKVGRR